jgi:hypothetical protein
MKYTCPCCGYKTLSEEPPATYEICPICFWEEDDSGPDGPCGPNHVTLREAQQNFIKFGYSDERLKEFVRPPNSSDVKDENWKPY